MNNQLLIASQAAGRGFTPTHVAGFRAWQEHGRAVRKGEKGLAILAPTPHLVPISDGDDLDPVQVVQTEKGPRKRVMGYRVTHVWDIAQTDAIDGSDAVKSSGPNGTDADAPDPAVLERVRGELEHHLRNAGYTVAYTDPGAGRLGATNPRAAEVLVAPNLDARQQVTTLAHELAHVQLGHTDAGYDYRRHRGAAEVQAESVAFVLLGAHGIDAGDDSVSYVAGWAGEDDDAVRTAAETVTHAVHALLAETESDSDSGEGPPASRVARAMNQAVPSGEPATISEARDVLHALGTTAQQGHGRVETLVASLRAADLDATTLGNVAEVLDAADAMVAASARARAGLNNRHQAIEEAVNATPHAAKTSFYRHGRVSHR